VALVEQLPVTEDNPERERVSGFLFFRKNGAFFVLPIVLLGLRSYVDLEHITLLVLLLVSLISVAWCDVALIVDAKRLKHIGRIAEYRFPLTGDWIVWIVASCVSLIVIPGSVVGIFEYRRNGRFDILAGGLVLGIVTLLFDLALVSSAMKMRREQRSRNPKL
jgi:uncharacterized membrane protein YkvI